MSLNVSNQMDERISRIMVMRSLDIRVEDRSIPKERNEMEAITRLSRLARNLQENGRLVEAAEIARTAMEIALARSNSCLILLM